MTWDVHKTSTWVWPQGRYREKVCSILVPQNSCRWEIYQCGLFCRRWQANSGRCELGRAAKVWQCP
uniref:Uncharacterized protein n=1 Tax=Anguilla anguilla TaxID=7936 RepID=A0A0E9SRG3_ANGAN